MLMHGLFLFSLHPPLKQWGIKMNFLNVSIFVRVENFQPQHPHNFNYKNVYFWKINKHFVGVENFQPLQTSQTS